MLPVVVVSLYTGLVFHAASVSALNATLGGANVKVVYTVRRNGTPSSQDGMSLSGFRSLASVYTQTNTLTLGDMF